MPEVLPSVPGFSEQQVHDLVNIINSVIQQYFAPQTPPSSTPSSSTPSAPQEAQKEENKQLLQQATVENTTESITKHSSSVPNSKSTISTIPRLCTAHSATYISNLACQHIMIFNTLLGYTLLGYIEHSKGLEATEQG